MFKFLMVLGLLLSPVITSNGFEEPDYVVGMLNEQVGLMGWELTETYADEDAPFRIEKLNGNQVLQINNRYRSSQRAKLSERLYPTRRVTCTLRFMRSEGWLSATEDTEVGLYFKYDRYESKLDVTGLPEGVWHTIKFEIDHSVGYKLRTYVNDVLVSEDYGRVYSGRWFTFQITASKRTGGIWTNILSYVDDLEVDIE